MKKLRLDAEKVAVESFPVARAAEEDGRGTVHARGGCTYDRTCLCPTAYYYCGDGYQTLYSCQYSVEGPCPTSIHQC